ncbi:MAG: hypothetical protein AAF614_09850 [Chloroflexota bacterium]
MKVADFLVKLGKNPDKLEAFQHNPLQLMIEEGLSTKEQSELGFDEQFAKFSNYEDGSFYVDFNEGHIVAQMLTKTPILSEVLPNLQVGWKITEDGQLQMNQPMPADVAGQVIIEGGLEVELQTGNDTQRNRVWIIDKISGKCYPADILHLKVVVHTDQDCC